MDLVSLLITTLGIMILLGLYVMSRLFNQTPSQKSNKTIKIPTYTDTEGVKLSSIKADIPASAVTNNSNFTAHTDYSSQAQQSFSTSKADDNSVSMASTSTQTVAPAQKNAQANTQPHEEYPTEDKPKLPSQFVLFIASPSAGQLDGNLIITAMSENNLKLGDKDIYHYSIADSRSDQGTSLFSVANGVSPWTLRAEDLIDQGTPGLSLIMPMPAPIDARQAIDIFVDIGEKLAQSINGELQNTQQQLFLPTDKKLMLESVS